MSIDFCIKRFGFCFNLRQCFAVSFGQFFNSSLPRSAKCVHTSLMMRFCSSSIHLRSTTKVLISSSERVGYLAITFLQPIFGCLYLRFAISLLFYQVIILLQNNQILFVLRIIFYFFNLFS